MSKLIFELLPDFITTEPSCNSTPAINATNLDKMETGIKSACDGVDAVNTELGTNPSGTDATVVARLDRIETTFVRESNLIDDVTADGKLYAVDVTLNRLLYENNTQVQCTSTSYQTAKTYSFSRRGDKKSIYIYMQGKQTSNNAGQRGTLS